ncbi:MAG: hydrogenase formation protein HypD [Bacillota bacterium]
MSAYSGNSSPHLPEVLSFLAREIHSPLNLMEVCGTHTVAILRFGFKSYFKGKINFLSGPGCPVCVTAPEDIDRILALAERGVTIVTFGDLLKVPGSGSSLAAKRAEGAAVHVVYNPLEALAIAGRTKNETVFIGIGFETTAPLVAALVEEIVARRIDNLSLYPLLKTIPPAMEHLLSRMEHRLDGLLCPGHVSAIIGEQPYDFIAARFHLPCVIAGFEREDIARGLLALLRQIKAGEARVENRYARVVRREGNPRARELIYRYFRPEVARWRGLGEIPASGLALRPEYEDYHILRRVPIPEVPAREPAGCLCGRIICGLNNPEECPHFGRDCTPVHPLGPCMVSGEGSCQAHYLYGRE